jgi:hypothetical protein
MRQLFSLAVLSALFTVTSAGVPDKAPQLYRGEYFYNFESAAFTPEGATEAWCVDSAKLRGAELSSTDSRGRSSGTAHIVVRGVLSPKGHYCSLGGYKHFLNITEVVEITNRRRS